MVPRLKTTGIQATRDNDIRIFKTCFKYDLRKFYFTNTVVDASNSLPNWIVMANSTNTFKRMLDIYTGWRKKKRPEHSHSVMQWSNRNESTETHVCNEQTSSNMSRNSRIKYFRISRDTNEIVLHLIKQCLHAVHHLCCRSYTGYTRTSQ